MLKNSKTTTTIALAFASLLAVGATAMAAPHRADKMQGTQGQVQSTYDARADAGLVAPVSGGEGLFDRAKGSID